MCNHVCYYIPSHILASIARARAMEKLAPTARAERAERPEQSAIQRSAVVSDILRQRRRQATLTTLAPPPAGKAAAHKAVAGLTIPPPGTHGRLIYDDQNQWNFDVQLIRGEGDPAVAQQNANLAYDALGATLAFYRDVLGRNSIDNLGINIIANVNFGASYDNAFWDGTRMVFGNGDNVIFQDFTNDVDVPGHELTHGVTQYTAGLQYSDQPGALNEATSDIFGACIDARVDGKDAGSFNWLIGEGVMASQMFGEAIRSMAYPGTAYDDPILGTDPQPATMAGYVPGGDPHLNSGIINRWFYLMATDLGMNEAALIWYATLQNLWPTTQFADAAHVAAAQARILARDGKVPSRAPQTVRGTARAQGII
jgi:Zn-dependent metalloprotease